MDPIWQNILNKINAPRSEWRLLSKEVSAIKKKLETGVAVTSTELLKAKDAWRSKYPFTDSDNRFFVLYIYDQSSRDWKFSYYGKQKSSYKFHFCWCSTLEDMESRGRRARYKAKYDIENNLFEVAGVRQSKQVLEVCMNCLANMNYQGYKNSFNKRTTIYKSFDIKSFFESIRLHNLKIPTHQYHSGLYTKDWNEISKRKRKESNDSCSDCASSEHLQVHHINGVRSDNSDINLKVLCRSCHEKQPFHAHMKSFR